MEIGISRSGMESNRPKVDAHFAIFAGNRAFIRKSVFNSINFEIF